MTSNDIQEFRRIAGLLDCPKSWQDRQVVLTAMAEVAKLSDTIKALTTDNAKAKYVALCYSKLVAAMRNLVAVD